MNSWGGDGDRSPLFRRDREAVVILIVYRQIILLCLDRLNRLQLFSRLFFSRCRSFGLLLTSHGGFKSLADAHALPLIDVAEICGPHDRHLALIEQDIDVYVMARGNRLDIKGGFDQGLGVIGLGGIEYLVNRRFPTLKARRTAAFNQNQTPSDRERTLLLIQEADRFRDGLLQKPRTEIEALVEAERAAEQEEARQRADREERARFFHKPETTADFDFWSRAAYWTIDEAVALSLGKQPQAVSWDTVRPHLGSSPFAVEFEQRRMLATRAKDANQLTDANLPGFFLAWAARNRVDVPPELVEAVEAHGHQVADWKSAYDEAQATISALQAQLEELTQEPVEEGAPVLAEKPEKPLINRERKTALKLIIGIALVAYGAEPFREKRSSIYREIADDLADQGLSITDDTVRKWLHEALDEHLPASVTEQENGES